MDNFFVSHMQSGRKFMLPMKGMAGGVKAKSRKLHQVFARRMPERDDVDSLDHARRELTRWRYDYNHVGPHSALGGAAPATLRPRLADGRPG